MKIQLMSGKKIVGEPIKTKMLWLWFEHVIQIYYKKKKKKKKKKKIILFE